MQTMLCLMLNVGIEVNCLLFVYALETKTLVVILLIAHSSKYIQKHSWKWLHIILFQSLRVKKGQRYNLRSTAYFFVPVHHGDYSNKSGP